MIALIDYGMGNLLSVSKAFAAVEGRVEIITKPSDLKFASAVVLPGVGSFGDGMENLNTSGMGEAIRNVILGENKPFLGICLGMQMLMNSSEESPGVAGLKIFKGKVIKFQAPENTEETNKERAKYKIPHMGWNQIKVVNAHSCIEGIENGTWFYFVHSYYVVPEGLNVLVASSDYITEFAAAIGRGNIFATQFHPEKSQDKGLRILKNFVRKAEIAKV